MHPVYVADGVFWDAETDSKKTSSFSVLPLHETLDSVVIDGEEDDWCNIEDSQRGFLTALSAWGSRTGVATDTGDFVCIGLWGDSAPHTHRDSLNLIQFTVLSGIHRKRYWICAFPKRDMCRCGCFGRCSFDAVFEVVAWSLRALAAGVFPSVDHKGVPFPDESYRGKLAKKPMKVRGACVAMCADWAWHKQVLGMQGWRGEGDEKRMCWMCCANSSNCFDVSMAATWRTQLVDALTFWEQAAHNRRYISSAWSIPGFSISLVRPDFMHTVCLGVLQYLGGNVMYDCFRALGGTWENSRAAVSKLEAIVKTMARQLAVPPPFHCLTIGMFRSSGAQKPKLKLKAAEGRYCLPLVRHMLEHCFPTDTLYAKTRLLCVGHLCKCYAELDNWVDGGESRLRLASHARKHVVLYQELSRLSTDELMWHMYPKHHLFVHVAETSYVNPRCRL